MALRMMCIRTPTGQEQYSPAIKTTPGVLVMPMVPLHTLVAEARQLGAEFHLSGSKVVVEDAGAIPRSLKKELRGRHDELYSLLASKSTQLLLGTGITVKVAATAAQEDSLVSGILDDAGSGPVGIEIETNPFTEGASMLQLTRTGAVKASNRKQGLIPTQCRITVAPGLWGREHLRRI